MRRFGRELAESFRRGLDEASADVAREVAALREAMAAGKQFDGMLAVLGGTGRAEYCNICENFPCLGNHD